MVWIVLSGLCGLLGVGLWPWGFLLGWHFANQGSGSRMGTCAFLLAPLSICNLSRINKKNSLLKPPYFTLDGMLLFWLDHNCFLPWFGVAIKTKPLARPFPIEGANNFFWLFVLRCRTQMSDNLGIGQDSGL